LTDIKGVDLVLNYEIPTNINDYIQRVGRTGRVGVAGETLSFFDEDVDADLAKDLVAALLSRNQKVPQFPSDLCAGAGETRDDDYETEESLFKKMKVSIYSILGVSMKELKFRKEIKMIFYRKNCRT